MIRRIVSLMVIGPMGIVTCDAGMSGCGFSR